jgi:ubiquinone biosynthesis protein UbiJ
MKSYVMPEQALCAALEFVINKALALNSQGTFALNNLVQQTLTVKLSELGFPLCFTVSEKNADNHQVLVTTLAEYSACTLDTSIKTLVELKKDQQLTELIKQEKLDLSGDIKVAQQFASIAQTLDIDWQSELALRMGDVPTHKLVTFGKKMAQKFAFAREQIQADASEWLVHEKRLVIPSGQMNDFSQQVDEVALLATSLEQRLAELANKISIKLGESR